MKWFKMHSEARVDNKLRALNDAEHRAWFNLLCMAAEQKTRGCIEGRSFRLVAIEVCSGDCDQLRGLLTKLVGMEMVELSGGAADDDKCEVSFIKFSDRQTDKPSNSAEAVTKRVQRHRGKIETPNQDDETPCNAPETPCNALHDECNADVTPQSREEEIREEKKQQRASAPGPLSPDSEIGMAVRAICRKTSLELSSFDARDIKNLLVSFDARNVPISQVEEFGRKWPGFWKGAKGAPPGIRDVMEQWDVVLALDDPGGEGGNGSIWNSDGSLNVTATRRLGAELSGGGGVPRR